MKKFLVLGLLISNFAVATVDMTGEFATYSNYLWRGTTFSENKPAVQGIVDVQEKHGLYLGLFVSNAEFSDEGMSAESEVTQETDITLGKRWEGDDWSTQLSFNRFYFPGAGIFDSDEYNFQFNFYKIHLELSYMGEYFGYQSVYRYIRLGYEWEYKPNVEGGFFVGYNDFSNPKGTLKSRCLDEACNEVAYTTNGAGNPNYVDVFFENRKIFKNGMSLELALNWTNREEYTADSEGIHLDDAKDFTIIAGLVFPFSI